MAESRNLSAPAPAGDDWTVKAADNIERLVTTVHDRAVAPLARAARYVVFGLLSALVGLTALVLLATLLVRVLVSYVPPHRAWLAHLITGGIFTLAGLFLFGKARRSRSAEH